MTKYDSLKKALKVRARLAKERNSPNVKKELEIYNKSIVRKRDKLESVRGKVKTVRLPVSEYKKWTPKMNAMIYHGPKAERPEKLKQFRELVKQVDQHTPRIAHWVLNSSEHL